MRCLAGGCGGPPGCRCFPGPARGVSGGGAGLAGAALTGAGRAGVSASPFHRASVRCHPASSVPCFTPRQCPTGQPISTPVTTQSAPKAMPHASVPPVTAATTQA